MIPFIRFFFINCFSLLSYLSIGQQLPEQENFLGNSFLQNPAMTAPFSTGNAGLTHRTFWTGFEESPNSQSAFGQYPLEKMSVGLGFQRDIFGVWQQDILQATYAYQLDLGRGRSPQLSLGIGAGIVNSTFNLQNIVASNATDPLLPNEINTNRLAIFSGGLYFTTTDRRNDDRSYFAVGLAGKYILPANELFYTSSSNRQQERVIHANAIMSYRFLNDDNYFYFEPSIWLDFTQNFDLLSPVAQVKGGWSNGIGFGGQYRYNGNVSLQLFFNLQYYLESLPLTLGFTVIRPSDNLKRNGIGYGFMAQCLLETY